MKMSLVLAALLAISFAGIAGASAIKAYVVATSAMTVWYVVFTYWLVGCNIKFLKWLYRRRKDGIEI